MKKAICLFLVFLTVISSFVLIGCEGNYQRQYEESEEKTEKYEEQFLGKWSHISKDFDALLSFQYKDGIYSGGALNSELNIVTFVKYVATKDTLIIYLEDGSTESMSYEFRDGYLYLDDLKFEKK